MTLQSISKYLNLKIFLILIPLLAACEETQSSDLHGNVGKDQRFDRWRDPMNIPVCWEPLTKVSEADLTTVAEAVTTQFLRAGLFLSFQGKCVNGSRGIRVQANMEGTDYTSYIGARVDGKPGGVRLNFARPCSKRLKPYTCLINTALHEFGHALGLHHEMNRRDHSSCAKDQTEGKGSENAIPVGIYDNNSIMSYCRDRSTVVLSDSDIASIADYYFTPLARISSHVEPKSAENPRLFIEGLDIVAYRWLLTADVKECVKDEAYSRVVATGEGFVVPTESYAIGQRLHVCVIGQNEKGDWQPLRSFSSISWEKIAEL